MNFVFLSDSLEEFIVKRDRHPGHLRAELHLFSEDQARRGDVQRKLRVVLGPAGKLRGGGGNILHA